MEIISKGIVVIMYVQLVKIDAKLKKLLNIKIGLY